ncbi:hypothetical protein THASP1DRAFT_33262 [Thamnocephalis sphaerospora]|uniref:Uncharacterized protein n=1 Tax=Thamnocephalis sphaerospora TaxID=78915 RepID=A0A4P9XGY9_9FUNG|nr:hypothetical protein THASP1DRAFT_33262 [Thamnocephalis sphaerospora]|eukprot:RKP04916.1 hypothetical protein THASP1DRAFT_33262 [Thamnocephalis sphaerospora]
MAKSRFDSDDGPSFDSGSSSSSSRSSSSSSSSSSTSIVWPIIVLIVFLIAGGFHVFRYTQLRNKFHLALGFAALLQIVVAGLTLGGIFVPFLGPLSFWIIISVPAYLLGTWARSMSKHIGAMRSSRIFNTSIIWAGLFGVGVIMVMVFLILVLYVDIYYALTLPSLARAGYGIIIAGELALLLICIWQYTEIANASAALAVKRKQLTWLIILFGVLVIASICDVVGSSGAGYASGVMLMIYFVVTLSAVDAISGYHIPPNDAVVAAQQPGVIYVQQPVAAVPAGYAQPVVVANTGAVHVQPAGVVYSQAPVAGGVAYSQAPVAGGMVYSQQQMTNAAYVQQPVAGGMMYPQQPVPGPAYTQQPVVSAAYPQAPVAGAAYTQHTYASREAPDLSGHEHSSNIGSVTGQESVVVVTEATTTVTSAPLPRE